VLVALACAPFAFTQPVIGSAAHSPSIPLPVSPGELITLFVQGVNTQLTNTFRATGNQLPTKLAGVSVAYRQGLPASDRPAGILEVRPLSECLGMPVGCGTMLAVTAQLPFEMLTFCPLCAIPVDISYFILVSVDGEQSAAYAVQPFYDHIHILTVCDIAALAGQATATPLPCSPMLAHADRILVSTANPSKERRGIDCVRGRTRANESADDGSPSRNASGADAHELRGGFQLSREFSRHETSRQRPGAAIRWRYARLSRTLSDQFRRSASAEFPCSVRGRGHVRSVRERDPVESGGNRRFGFLV